MIKELKLIHRLPSSGSDDDDRRPVEAILSAYTKAAATKRKREPSSSAVSTTPSSGDRDYLSPPVHKRSHSNDYLREDEREESHHPASSLDDDDECIGLVTSYRRTLHRQGTVRSSNRMSGFGDDERRESPTPFHETAAPAACPFPSLQRATTIFDDSSDSLDSLTSDFSVDPPEMTVGSRPSSSMEEEPLDAELAGSSPWGAEEDVAGLRPAGDAAEERELPEWLAGGSYAPAPFAFRPAVPVGAFRPINLAGFHHGRA